MTIGAIINSLRSLAPESLQESYDNAGLLLGDTKWECKGVLISLDATEEIINEAIERNCNLVVSHHPILFKGIKKMSGNSYVEKVLIKAIKHDVALYAIHTNLDNLLNGVNARIADKLGLLNRRILAPLKYSHRKLFFFVPESHSDLVRDAIFAAGAGRIGNYAEVSFNTKGQGSFRPDSGARPFIGEVGQRHYEKEIRIELLYPLEVEKAVIAALIANHPYEEVAYDVLSPENPQVGLGAGMIGHLPVPMGENELLALIRERFHIPMIRHSALLNKKVQKLAICGGAGSSFISNALGEGVDFYITADIKYHEFFDAEGRLLIADIGHFESEQFTIELLHEFLTEKFPNFAILKPVTQTNPVHYYL